MFMWAHNVCLCRGGRREEGGVDVVDPHLVYNNVCIIGFLF